MKGYYQLADFRRSVAIPEDGQIHALQPRQQ